MSLLSGLWVPSGGGILFLGFHRIWRPQVSFSAFKVTAIKGEGTTVESVGSLFATLVQSLESNWQRN